MQRIVMRPGVGRRRRRRRQRQQHQRTRSIFLMGAGEERRRIVRQGGQGGRKGRRDGTRMLRLGTILTHYLIRRRVRLLVVSRSVGHRLTARRLFNFSFHFPFDLFIRAEDARREQKPKQTHTHTSETKIVSLKCQFRIFCFRSKRTTDR